MDFIRAKLEIADFDQLAQIVRGWETEPVQLSPGALNLVAKMASGNGFSVLQTSLAPRLSNRSIIHPGTTCFFLAERPLLWCGLEITVPALVKCGPGNEYRSVLEPGFRSVAFVFSQHDLANHPLGDRLPGESFEPERSVFPVSEHRARDLRAAADTVLQAPGFASLAAEMQVPQDCVRDHLLGLLDGVAAPHLPNVPDGPRPQRRARYRLALTALRKIERIGTVGATPVAIAEDLGVTRRALEQAFKSVLSISPAQYLIAARLVQVKNRLITEGGRVIDTAFDMGFQDPSRFTCQYRRLFGELPSESLLRGRRRRGDTGRKQ